MRLLQRKKSTKSLVDVHFPDVKKDLRFLERQVERKIINLKPSLYRRFPLVLIGGSVALGSTFFLLSHLLTRAEVADFYASTCLGTWQNPQYAQGEPESNGIDGFTASTSAVYEGGDHQIFCGGFVPLDQEEKGDIEDVGVTLLWRVGEVTSSASDVSSTSPSGVATSSDSVSGTSEGPSGASSTEHIPPPPLPSAFFWDPKRLVSLLVNRALANDSSSVSFTEPSDMVDAASTPSANAPSPPTASDTQTTSSDSSLILGQQDTKDASSTFASSSDAIASSEVNLPAPALPDENFLKISYSTDGATWYEIQKVESHNWPTLTLALPLHSWQDLKKVQLRIDSIATTLTQVPQVYLDALLLEVHYTVPPVILSQNTSPGTSEPRVVDGGAPGVSIELPALRAMPTIPAPEIVSSTMTSDRWHLTIRYVGPFFHQPLNVFLYPFGTTAERNNAENGFTFATSPDGPFIDAVQLFASDFPTGQTDFDIVAPDADQNYGLKTSVMSPGRYNIDISYYDGQTWHLTEPQVFDWPRHIAL